MSSLTFDDKANLCVAAQQIERFGFNSIHFQIFKLLLLFDDELRKAFIEFYTKEGNELMNRIAFEVIMQKEAKRGINIKKFFAEISDYIAGAILCALFLKIVCDCVFIGG